MKSKTVWALVALNAFLLATLIGQWLKPNTALAQMQRPSDYILIPGHVQASPAEVLYMIDTQNGLLSARMYDGQKFVDMAPINLNRYLNQPAGGAGRGGVGGRRGGRY